MELIIPSQLSQSICAYWSNILGTSDCQRICQKLHGVLGQFLNKPLLLGIGQEAIVFRDCDMVKKYLLSWPKNRPSMADTYNELQSVAKRIPEESSCFYTYNVRIIHEHVIEITYRYEDYVKIDSVDFAQNWHTLWRDQIITVIHEASTLGIVLLDPKISNFIFVENALKFIDYGRDITTVEKGTIELHRMFCMYKNGIYDLGPSGNDFFR